MITKSTGYQSSDGKFHPSLELAQQAELELLLKDAIERPTPLQGGATFLSSVVGEILERRDNILDILTTTTASKPKARKINGGTKKRQPKHIAEQFSMPLGEPAAK